MSCSTEQVLYLSNGRVKVEANSYGQPEVTISYWDEVSSRWVQSYQSHNVDDLRQLARSLRHVADFVENTSDE